jgi:ribosomal protein L11 methyltransferase
VLSLTLECPQDQAELVSAELWDLGACGVQEEDVPVNRTRLRAFFETAPDLSSLQAYEPLLEEEPDVDWVAESLNAWPPLEVGSKFHLAPPWNTDPAPPGRIRLTIHPGMAFGTGAHNATQLCLEALEQHLRPGDSVLDLGTGSGILAAAAHHLGAHRTIGCDVDLDSVCIAKDNLAADGIPASVFAGSARSVASNAFDLVVANINAETHRALVGDYVRLARRTLILSGMTVSDRLPVPPGFSIVDRLTSAEWLCLVLCKDEPF